MTRLRARALLGRRSASVGFYKQLRNDDLIDGPNGRIAFVVDSADYGTAPDESWIVGGLARACAAMGYGVRLVPKDQWNTHQFADDSLVIVTDPTFTPDQVPANIPLIGWIFEGIAAWLRIGQLAMFDLLLAASELARIRITQDFAGPVGVLPLAVDVELFGPGRLLAGRRGDIEDSGKWSSLPRRFGRANTVTCAGGLDLGYGIVSARTLAAAASGAVPLVRSRLGLTELDLGEIPVCRTSREHAGTLLELANHDDLATKRSQIVPVARGHSFVVRAQELKSLLPGAIESTRTRPTTIEFFPDYRDTNPYQRILYAQTALSGTRVIPAKSPLTGLCSRDDGGDLSGRIFHLHWTNPVFRGAKTTEQADAKLDQFAGWLADLQARGGKFVWTVHNVLPHERKFLDQELRLASLLVDRADLIHVMSAQTLEQVRPHYKIPSTKVVVIPHPSYAGVYPDFVSRDIARSRLGIESDEVVLLTLGAIRGYKGIDRLFAAVDGLAAVGVNVRLNIVGRVGRGEGNEQLLERCRAHPRIQLEVGYVPDAQLQLWLRSADLAVLPYRKILNSGAFHLALGFGVPVVYPLDGSMASPVSQTYGEGFDPDSEQDLLRALTEAVGRLTNVQARDAAAAAGLVNPPQDVSARFHEAIVGLVCQP